MNMLMFKQKHVDLKSSLASASSISVGTRIKPVNRNYSSMEFPNNLIKQCVNHKSSKEVELCSNKHSSLSILSEVASSRSKCSTP